jgi:hypothetical protein
MMMMMMEEEEGEDEDAAAAAHDDDDDDDDDDYGEDDDDYDDDDAPTACHCHHAQLDLPVTPPMDCGGMTVPPPGGLPPLTVCWLGAMMIWGFSWGELGGACTQHNTCNSRG